MIPTLEEPDMILGMDVLQTLGVRINAKTGTAQPTMLITKLKPGESWKVPALTSIVFSIKNPYDEQDREEGEKKNLVPAKRETTTHKGDNVIGARTMVVCQVGKHW